MPVAQAWRTGAACRPSSGSARRSSDRAALARRRAGYLLRSGAPGIIRKTAGVDGVQLIGGPEKRTISVEPYRATWVGSFEEHRRRISETLGSVARRVDHIGSTAVVGLAAKPIIDIQISVGDVEDEPSYLDSLVAAGYRLRVRELGHRMFRTPELDVHVHVCGAGSAWERRHLLLRDWLRHSQDDREAYAALKLGLQQQDWETMNDYADAKNTLITAMTYRAEEWALASRWSP
ncbi:MAG TPA: GrpB family protein [Acidimicrobiales bacterium]|nr:GrpB family protein [Acidimicrobiales bacterium]